MKWTLLLFLIGSYNLLAQIPADKSISLSCDFFYGVDDFENLYFSTDNVLYKKSQSNRLEFFDIQLGDITSVDIINPLKILIFYRDTQTLVFLDNRLNEQQRLNLNTLKPQRFIEHARLAGERRLWLYNLDLSRLELYDYANHKLVNSTTPIKEQVIEMQSDYNFCHLITEKGIITYNTYASETSRILEELKLPVAFDFEQLGFQTVSGWKWYRFDKKFRFRESELTTPFSQEYSPESLYLKGGKLYLYHQKRLHVQTINLKKS
nr:hypothetical protein [Nonlabens ulvanivorans]